MMWALLVLCSRHEERTNQPRCVQSSDVGLILWSQKPPVGLQNPVQDQNPSALELGTLILLLEVPEVAVLDLVCVSVL